jgi:hypothetical protein
MGIRSVVGGNWGVLSGLRFRIGLGRCIVGEWILENRAIARFLSFLVCLCGIHALHALDQNFRFKAFCNGRSILTLQFLPYFLIGWLNCFVSSPTCTPHCFMPHFNWWTIPKSSHNVPPRILAGD